jgi:hypothetical protein
LENCRTCIERDTCWVADSSKLHARPDYTSQAEDDEKHPAGIPPEAVSDSEENGSRERGDVNDNFGD